MKKLIAGILLVVLFWKTSEGPAPSAEKGVKRAAVTIAAVPLPRPVPMLAKGRPSGYLEKIAAFHESFPERISGMRLEALPEGHPLTCAREEFLDACAAFLPAPLVGGRLSPRLRRIKFGSCRGGAAPAGPVHSPEEWAAWFGNRGAGDRSPREILQAVRCDEGLARYKLALNEGGAP